MTKNIENKVNYRTYKSKNTENVHKILKDKLLNLLDHPDKNIVTQKKALFLRCINILQKNQSNQNCKTSHQVSCILKNQIGASEEDIKKIVHFCQHKSQYFGLFYTHSIQDLLSDLEYNHVNLFKNLMMLFTQNNLTDCLNFDNLDLQRLDLSNLDLSNASFRNCNLQMTDFRGSNIIGSNFKGAFTDKTRFTCPEFHNLDHNNMVKTIKTFLKTISSISNEKAQARILEKFLVEINNIKNDYNKEIILSYLDNFKEIISNNKISHFDKTKNNSTLNSFHLAVASNDLNKIRTFVEDGININATDQHVSTVLHIACAHQADDALKYLLTYEVDIHALNDEKLKPIQVAYLNNSKICANMLKVKMGLIKKDYRKESALLLDACIKGDFQRVKTLIANGTPINTVYKTLNDAHIVEEVYDDKFLYRNLFTYSCHDVEITKLLLRAGADLNEKDNLGRTPLFYAISNKNEDVVKLLLENKADINIKDIYGNSPFNLAIWEDKKNIKIIKLLIEFETNVDIKPGAILYILQSKNLKWLKIRKLIENQKEIIQLKKTEQILLSAEKSTQLPSSSNKGELKNMTNEILNSDYTLENILAYL